MEALVRGLQEAVTAVTGPPLRPIPCTPDAHCARAEGLALFRTVAVAVIQAAKEDGREYQVGACTAAAEFGSSGNLLMNQSCTDGTVPRSHRITASPCSLAESPLALLATTRCRGQGVGIRTEEVLASATADLC